MKTLVSVCIWILFIFGGVILINTIVQSALYGLSEEITMISGAIAMVSFFLTTVAVKIRSNF